MPSLPSLPSLRAFEATVRLGGFARAAVELHVSTSAVSHQIRALEETLGVRLLERSTGLGGIALTQAGARLLPAASEALSMLEAACLEITKSTRRLTISANVSFSSMWLAQRMAAFSASHPEASLNSIVQEGPPDDSRYSVDVAIVHVAERDIQPDDLVLLREAVFPVCSPTLHAVAATAGPCLLLQQEHRDFPEIEWHYWMGRMALPDNFETKIVRYSSFSQVIGAAVAGAGLALGRLPLIESELKSGRLVRVRPDLCQAASWRYVLRRGKAREHRLVDRLIAFLQAEAAAIPEVTRQDVRA
ncbi:LysR family transcriptional regulator [Robbsia andropogonis]|uniref:LysR family transcriptional regulator n=1 Tax=Robbsia andropogonis TaxID=28092 RepID=UPI000465079E|nr:LysR family transcriptional regulator [Robbsia andropogonis]MCP1119245.1 LysR family transcriptional regulator [Robbsia andropogonis]MCP1129085.1 LysR family transcriptional regulator [Robbsia andropogonis]